MIGDAVIATAGAVLTSLTGYAAGWWAHKRSQAKRIRREWSHVCPWCGGPKAKRAPLCAKCTAIPKVGQVTNSDVGTWPEEMDA